MKRAALIAVCLLAGPERASAGDEVFERDLSTPFLRDDDDVFLRDRDLPGPLRKSWPYVDAPEAPFLAVEARRGCHARALHQIAKAGGKGGQAVARLQSRALTPLRYAVSGGYEADFGEGRQILGVRCEITSRAVVSFEFDVEK